jgi:ubiquinone/menaquinone biosynthesis C-methylase UbiE
MMETMSDFRYDEEVAERYDVAVPLYPGEIDFYLGLAKEAEGRGLRTLEPACGTGRVAIPLAREGIRIVGMDNSPAMLARARKKSADLSNAEWVEGDMRSFTLGESFGLVMIPAGSFQLLLTTEDQIACLESIGRHLEPGGRLVLALDNQNIVAMSEWLTTKRGTFQRHAARDHRDPETGREVRSWGSLEYRPSAQRYIASSLREELDEDGRVVERAYGQPMECRYLHRYEAEHLLARCGFAPEALYGDYFRAEYSARSPGMIWVARLP